MRILFAGTPEFALPPLRAVLESGHKIAAVLTQPDRPAGRGKRLRASPVKQLAVEHELEVLQPVRLGDPGWQGVLTDLQPDLMVVVAYGLMIPAWLLELPRLGCWNIHASLLPRWRGAAPIQRAIEAGDEETGVCIMHVEATLDTGPVYHCCKTAIGRQDTAGDLHDRLATMGAEALLYCLDLANTGALPPPLEQDHTQAVYASKLSKVEAELDWNQPAEILQRKIRAFNPWPVAWCQHKGQRLRIWQAEVVDSNLDRKPGQVIANRESLLVATASKTLQIDEIQRAGGKRLKAAEFLNACNARAGE